jgi:hypothetical protein
MQSWSDELTELPQRDNAAKYAAETARKSIVAYISTTDPSKRESNTP